MNMRTGLSRSQVCRSVLLLTVAVCPAVTDGSGTCFYRGTSMQEQHYAGSVGAVRGHLACFLAPPWPRHWVLRRAFSPVRQSRAKARPMPRAGAWHRRRGQNSRRHAECCPSGAAATACATTDSPFTAVDVVGMRAKYVADGFVVINGLFRHPHAVAALLAEANQLFQGDSAFRSSDAHTVYQDAMDTSLGVDHVRNRLQQSSKRIIDFARLGGASPLRKLYLNPHLLELVQAIVAPESKLYLSDCPFNAAYYNEYRAGDGLGWHFDKGEFGVNLILQPAESGGVFEFDHTTRSPQDPWAFDRVERVVEGNCSGTVSAEVGAGSLVIFRGKHSLHRVTPVRGLVPRINAILVYDSTPGQRLGEYSLKKFFGRSAAGAGAERNQE